MLSKMAFERKIEKNKEVKCKFCNWNFLPQPEFSRQGKKITRIITCPYCGNGVERTFDYKKFKRWEAFDER